MEIYRRMGLAERMRAAGYPAASPMDVFVVTSGKQWDITAYRPSAHPGARLPHMWLSDGRALQDLAGPDFTLVSLGGGEGAPCIEKALGGLGAPIVTLHLAEPKLRAVYEAQLLLLRPDMHVAWGGNAASADAEQLAALVTGR
jgi:hypothetical protein